MKKSRRQLEQERLAEEAARAERKERRRLARKALERDELADEVAAGAAGAAAAVEGRQVRSAHSDEARSCAAVARATSRATSPPPSRGCGSSLAPATVPAAPGETAAAAWSTVA